MKIISHLFENPDDKDPNLSSLLHGSMKKKVDDIGLVIDVMITDEQKDELDTILSHYGGLEKCKADLESVILSLCEPYTRELGLVSTVPVST